MNTEKQVTIPLSQALEILEVLPLTDRKDLLSTLEAAITEAEKPRFKVFGRRWHQKLYGTTYFKFSIEKDGEEIYTTSDMEYGYGDQYQTAAIQWLVKFGHIQSKGDGVPSWQYRDDNYIEFSVQDFERKKDF